MAVQEDLRLTGTKKASMLLLALGTSKSAQVLKHLSESEIERLSTEIVQMQRVDPAQTRSVLEEFERTSIYGTNAAGRDFATRVLDQVLGPEKSKNVLQRATASRNAHPFDFLDGTDNSVVADTISDELPRIGALVLVNLPPERAAGVLSELPGDIQAEIARCICTMGEVDQEAVQAIEEALKVKLSTESKKTISYGPNTLVQILNNSERSTERLILDALKKGDPSVGAQVRQMIFVFEDLTRIGDKGIQALLRRIDHDDLRLAIMGAGDELKELLYKNMTERAAEMIRDDIETLGSVRIKDIEAAQQRIASIVRRLIASQDISISEAEEEREA